MMFLSHLTDPQLISNIRNSEKLMPHVRELAASRSVSASSSVGTPHSHRSQPQSYQETDTGDGAGEIQVLARKILEAVETEAMPSIAHTPVQRDHADEELRRSVRAALGHGEGR
jgi:vacuolar protein 8